MRWDVFLSHASEDKVAVARPLARRLERAGLRVWLDEVQLDIGDSLRGKLDEGLAQSRFGVIVLSAAFFAKEWPQRELSALFARRDAILPVWHGLNASEIAVRSPLLADILAASTSDGLDVVAAKIEKVVRQVALAENRALSACGCATEIRKACNIVASVAERLPSSVGQYVSQIAELLRKATAVAPACCHLKRTVNRCSVTARRLSNRHRHAVRVYEKAKASGSPSPEDAYNTLLMVRSTIGDWCGSVERIIHQRGDDFLPRLIAGDFDALMSSRYGRWLIPTLEDVLNHYGDEVLLTNGPAAFVLLVDSQEQVVSRPAEAVIAIPGTRFMQLAQMWVELCHEVGAYAFFCRYAAPANIATSDDRQVSREELSAFWNDAVSVYADISVLGYALNHDIAGLTRLTARALLSSPMFREAADPVRDRWLVHLLTRLGLVVMFVVDSKRPVGDGSAGRISSLIAVEIVEGLTTLFEREVLPLFADVVITEAIKARAAANLATATAWDIAQRVSDLRRVMPPRSDCLAEDVRTLAKVESDRVELLTSREVFSLLGLVAAGRHREHQASSQGDAAATNALILKILRVSYLSSAAETPTRDDGA